MLVGCRSLYEAPKGALTINNVTDLIELARNRAIADAVMVSGDENLRVAVQVAQTFGVRVHLLAVGDASRNVSTTLQMEADSVAALDKTWLEGHLIVQNQVAADLRNVVRLSSEGDPSNSLEEVAGRVADSLLEGLQQREVEALRVYFAAGNQTVPPEYDRKLIAMTANRLSRRLEPAELRKVRGVFVSEVRKREPDETPYQVAETLLVRSCAGPVFSGRREPRRDASGEFDPYGHRRVA